MAIRSDFVAIYFGEHLGDNANDLNVPWATFVGNQTTVKNFYISDQPAGNAYLMLQAYDVHQTGHRILINGQNLSGFDIPRETGSWQTWMDVIDSGLLRFGNNTIQIQRDADTGDNFVVGNVVIHWREYAPTSPFGVATVAR